MKKLFTTAFPLLLTLFCIAQNGSITVTSVQQRTDGSGLVDVYFNLYGPDNAYFINMEVSFNAGDIYFPIPANAISGAVGTISPGNGKHIIWDGTQSYPNNYSNTTILMIVATSVGSLNPCSGAPSVTDIDGNVYNTEQIGDQCWMKENLRVTKYNNGEEIINGYSWYNDDMANKYLHGALYNWHTAASAKGLCPEGWHLPSDDEWTQLTNFISGGTSYGGQQLKSCRQVGSPLSGNCDTEDYPRWDGGGIYYGNDLHGFSGLPAGYFTNNYPWGFQNMGSIAIFWTSTEIELYFAYNRSLNNNGFSVGRNSVNKYEGLSVRCLKD